ncbi:hypothetical protein SAMN04489842_2553 [Natronobacterium texcoconense]|uniref:Uncharacterized protein n=1 Tax=Natronobacterium texcoconense TaxID=1095778 RepID=A0A1H1GQS8_NATTX|nr:hypothetical protein SAMN04489842_2553 [Natronobacterium texcoconense]
MTESWEDLFERGATYDVSLERIRSTIADLDEGDDD